MSDWSVSIPIVVSFYVLTSGCGPRWHGLFGSEVEEGAFRLFIFALFTEFHSEMLIRLVIVRMYDINRDGTMTRDEILHITKIAFKGFGGSTDECTPESFVDDIFNQMDKVYTSL
jgi:hypothetical protein